MAEMCQLWDFSRPFRLTMGDGGGRSSANCSLFWDSYVNVKYSGSCDVDFMDEVEYPSFVRLYVSISLSVLGAFFNFWALILLILDYRGPPPGASSVCVQSKSGQSGKSQKSSHGGTKRTTMQVGLMIFCLFEVLYHAAYTGGEGINLYAYKIIYKGTIPKPINGSLSHVFSVLPPLSSFFNWFRDTGICGRNWAITLITIARAEVVVWPLASRFYQRCLRKKRIFLLVFSLFALTGVIISGVRRFDQKISVCYSEKFTSHCIKSEVFLLSDLKRFSAAYFSFQTLLPWLLILIFTTLIIIQLKPCKKESQDFLHHPNAKSGGRDNHLRASIAVTVIAVFCTIFEFPTFAVSMYYIAGDPDVGLGVWDIVANTLLQIDSIANFFLLIITMPSLRRRLGGTKATRSHVREASTTEMRTVVADSELTSKDRR